MATSRSVRNGWLSEAGGQCDENCQLDNWRRSRHASRFRAQAPSGCLEWPINPSGVRLENTFEHATYLPHFSVFSHISWREKTVGRHRILLLMGGSGNSLRYQAEKRNVYPITALTWIQAGVTRHQLLRRGGWKRHAGNEANEHSLADVWQCSIPDFPRERKFTGRAVTR